MEATKQEQEELLKWLFGSDVKIMQEEDITLAPYYDDFNIYYTEDIYNLFQTKPMKREGKILQLGSDILENPNCYHTRLQHSKGAYRNIIQFLTIQYRNLQWRKYIEQNKLKGYLVEKIKFMCIHDIGHAMFSHSVEKLIGDDKCTHEDVGNRILKENKEVREALDKIKPLEEGSNLEGDGSLEALCEGNIDFDRMDYIIRDRTYTGREYVNGLILKLNMLCCDLEYVPEQGKYQYVYKPEALPYIQDFLKLRIDMYKNEYWTKDKVKADRFVCYLLEEINNGRIQSTQRFRKYLDGIIGKSVEDIDIESFMETNDIVFLNQLIDKENDAVNLITQNTKALFQLAVSLLDPQHTDVSEYSDEEKEFIKKLRSVISRKNINTPKITLDDIILSVELEEDKRKEIQEKIKEVLENKEVDGIYDYITKFKSYNKNVPIYIKDENGTIYKFNEYPRVDMNLEDELRYGVGVIIPELKRQGISLEEIKQIKQLIESYQGGEQKEVQEENQQVDPNRMSIIKTGKANYLDRIEVLFEREL